MFDLKSLKKPTSPEEAVKDLLHTDGAGLYVAGGTIVVPTGSPALDYLVDLSHVGLEYVRVEDADVPGGRALVIGAMTRIADLLEETAVDAPCWRAIKEACFWLATHTVRNQATVGGNITAAHFPSDLPPVFVALDAAVVLQGENDRREVALADLYERRAEIHKRGDLIVEVRVPAGPEGLVSAFEKTGRTRVDIAIVNCAAALAVTAGAIEHARIALNGMAAVPFVAADTQAFLMGKKPSEEVFEEAGRMVSASVSPRSDHRASADYRRKIAGVLAQRALARAAGGPEDE
ncbi:MAG: FAD binding domain-containing protein [Candidatus Eisenbacteria bacterium]|nr:FAD binding domain-containing protein [Candidatus Eisenbacteria bacterium]